MKDQTNPSGPPPTALSGSAMQRLTASVVTPKAPSTIERSQYRRSLSATLSRAVLPAALLPTLLPALLSCNADGTTPTLLDSEGRVVENTEPVSDELARLRKLQEVTWTVDDGTGPVSYEGSANQLVANIAASCTPYYSDAVDENHPCFFEADEFRLGNGCGMVACDGTFQSLCIAHRLLEIADSLTAEGYSVQDELNPNRRLTVPPQSAGARADLRKEAMNTAKEALTSSLGQLISASTSTSCAASADDVASPKHSMEASYHGIVAGQMIAQQAIEALNLYREAAKSAAYEVVNYAETFRGHPTQSEAVRNSMAGEELSRAEGVHILIGGSAGLDGHPGMCTYPNLTPTEQAISEVLIDKGICPADFNSPLASDVTGWIEAAEAAGVTASDREFLSVAQALSQQATALGASSTASYMDAEGNVVFTGLQQPNDIDALYYAAIGRYYGEGVDEVPRSDTGVNAMPTLSDLQSATNYADVLDIAGQLLATLVARTWPPSLKSSVEAPLAMELAAVDAERLGRMKLCTTPVSFPGQVVVWGYSTADHLLVVNGEDGLKCAVNGNIDGTSCDLFDANNHQTTLVFSVLNSNYGATGSGFETAVSGYVPAFEGFEPEGKRAYLVRPKDGLEQAPGNYEALAAGTFFTEYGCDVVPIVPELNRQAGEWLRPNKDWCTLPAEECDGTFFDDKIPLEDELTDDGDGVENSWKHYLALAKQAADEADLLGQQMVAEGLDVDRRTEELELRKRGQDVEAIRELEELQTICGTDVDPYALLGKLGNGCNVFDRLGEFCDDQSDCSSGSCLRGRCSTAENWLIYLAVCGREGMIGQEGCTSDAVCAPDETCVFGDVGSVCIEDSAIDLAFSGGDLSNVVRGSCAADVECDQEEGYICRAGKCTLSPEKATEDWESEPEIARLNACLGADQTVESAVAAGDAPLCFWRSATHPNEICTIPEGYTGGGDCPVLATDVIGDPCTGLTRPTPSQGLPELIVSSTTSTLGYFNSADASGTVISTQACDALREWRANPSNDSLRTALRRGFNGYEALKRAASKISWTADLGAHYSVTLGGKQMPQFTTGNIRSGISDVGVCTVENSCDHSILTCGPGCESSADRGAIGRRLRDAVLVLQAAVFPEVANDPRGILDFLPVNKIGYQNIPVELFTPLGRFFTENYAPIYYFQNSVEDKDHPSAPFNRYVWSNEQLDEFDISVPMDISPTLVSGYSPNNLRHADRATLRPSVTDGGGLKDLFFDGLFPDDSRGRTNSGRCNDQGTCWLTEFMSRRSMNEASESEGSGVVISTRELEINVTARHVLDALELACEAAVEESAPFVGRIDLSDLPDIQGAGALDFVNPYLKDLERRINLAGSRLMLFNMPTAAADALREQGSAGAFPTIGGQYGASVAALRAALVQLSNLMPQLAAQVRQMENDTDALRARLAAIEAETGQQQIQYKQQVANNITSCVTAASQSVQLSFSAIGAGQAAIATCINSAYQSQLAEEILSLQADEAQQRKNELFAEFRGLFDQRAEALRELGVVLTESAEALDSQLAALENQRLSARRALARALQTASYQATTSRYINNALRSRFTTTRSRYEAAHRFARKMAILARRSIETRLGAYFADMTEDLPLVEAPSRWANDVCTATGIDFNALRDTGEPLNYSEEFIGDYVRKLESVVEGYRLSYNFHEGTDTASVSLRDDVKGIRDGDACYQPSANLLANSADLSPQPAGPWRLKGCSETGAETTLCIGIMELPEEQPIESNNATTERIPGYLVTFESNIAATCTVCTPPEARLEQEVLLAAGSYVLSWHTKSDPQAGGPNYGQDLMTVSSEGTQVPLSHYSPSELESGWLRHQATFTLAEARAIGIGVTPALDVDGLVVTRQLMLAGISLERAQVESGGTFAPARPFEPTDEKAQIEVEVCQDTDGDKFRADWVRRCLTLCNNGFSGECPQTDAKEYCFMETSFDLSQKQIELGNQLTQSGFARGNFNYRIEDIAVNFVGTDLRSCENSDLPQTCFAAGFIPYSLVHTGKYTVRNHAGESFDAKLYEGNIEHARGLATERYLSNPLSDADSSLLSQYMRSEFKGRPLDGQFVIRVWEDDQFSFEKIQDVQLVLKYRYWTRFN